MNITKGTRITARWFRATNASLAGMQPKIGAEEVVVSGIVRHFRGDHPTNPTKVRLYIDAPGADVTPEGCTCGPHVEIDPAHVVSAENAS